MLCHCQRQLQLSLPFGDAVQLAPFLTPPITPRRQVGVPALRRCERPLLPRLPAGALRADPGAGQGAERLAVPALLRGRAPRAGAPTLEFIVVTHKLSCARHLCREGGSSALLHAERCTASSRSSHADRNIASIAAHLLNARLSVAAPHGITRAACASQGWICNSSICMTRRGMKPTGIAIFDAQVGIDGPDPDVLHS